jgi:predicted permease
METWLKDVKFGAKLLLRDRGFAATAVLTIALAIGANVAVFSIVRSVLLKPLPFPDGDRLVYVQNSYPNAGVARADSSVPDYYDRRELPALSTVAVYRFEGMTVGEPSATRRLRGLRVTPSFFRAIGAESHRGRLFTEDESVPGSDKKAVLTYGTWQELFGGEENVLGREIRINGLAHTIVGVLPEKFLFLSPEVRLILPAAFTEEEKSDEVRHNNNWEMLARLAPGETVATAQAQIDALNQRNLERFPELAEALTNAGFHTVILDFRDELTRDLRGTLHLLWGGVAFVLLIAAVNIANLVLVRSQARLKELAVRSSIGGGRLRLARGLVIEMVELTLVGGALGLGLGYAALRFLRAYGIDELPRGSEIALDLVSVALTLLVALGLGAILALIPVARMLQMNLSDIVHQEGRTSTGGRGSKLLRHSLVVAQVAIALVLLVGAGLLLASFRHVVSVDPGFRPAGTVTAAVSLPPARYPEPADLRSFYERALRGIRALPGVEAAGSTSSIPLGGSYSDSIMMAEGYQLAPGESIVSPSQVVASPGYFEAMGIPLVRGRFFEEGDDENAPNRVIVDERLAARFWPGGDPVGKRLYTPSNAEDLAGPSENATWFHVVGVVGAVRERGLVDAEERVGMYYFPYRQAVRRFQTFAIRTGRDAESLAREFRSVIGALDPEIPVFDIRTMEERLDASLLARKTSLLLSLAFGILALLLAALGIYGVLAYLVTQRTREIGIRMALGSSTRSASELVLKEGAAMLGLGLALGVAGALALGRLLEGQLHGVSPAEPWVLGLVAALLSVSAFAAAAVPARRAARIHPMEAMRAD